jgi:hypothetical protein
MGNFLQAWHAQKQSGEGTHIIHIYPSQLMLFTCRAMALKALDQRLANNSSPVGSSSTNSSQHRAPSTTNVGRADKSSSSSDLPLSVGDSETEEVKNIR